ncbi:MAG: coproporphyrinogen-III oxidase family protein, partial [Nocardioidaceae bacterium]
VADWRRSLDAALACGPDHLSAYSLIVEPGTALGRRVRRGELPEPDQDDLADKYELADDVLREAGLGWYEISNWARSPEARCRHNLLYWTGADWWGIGPGAHSHLAGERWWNVKHPRAYAERIASGVSPEAGHERLDEATRRLERIMLEVRLVDGLGFDLVEAPEVVDRLVSDGLVEPGGERVVLTRRGRLLADAVVRELSR